MRRRKVTTIAGAVAGLAIVAALMLSGVARAGYGDHGRCPDHHRRSHCPKPPTPALTITDSRPLRGASIGVTGTGFPATTPVTITLHSSEVLLGQTTSDPTGHFSIMVTIPATTRPGHHEIVASAVDAKSHRVFSVLDINVRSPHRSDGHKHK